MNSTMTEKRENVLLTKSFNFAIRIIKLNQYLVAEKKEYVLSKQSVRSGTAIGALIREAQNAESKADFVHKLGIAQKECDETIYWLELLKETNYINKEEFESMNSVAIELLKMIRSSILTIKQKNKV
jgi:four helix bundle protein